MTEQTENQTKTVLITGGSRGIGAAIAHKFAANGYHIIIVSRSGSTPEHVDALTAYGVEVRDFKGDVTDFSFAKEIMDTVKADFNTLDVLVNNAGITRDTLLMRMKESDFDAVIDINLKGTFNFIQAASKLMMKQRAGAIINIASVVGEMGNVGQANYAASKAGMLGLTKSAARELGMRGITVNAVAPGYIETDMTDEMPEKAKAAMLENIPLSKLGQPSDIAEAVYFLATQSYITGTTLDVNGGLYMN
ncbi:3-oxoacyl-[acyl-carrier-protein] reductase [Aerococcus agrisoli]|uniref:3-oxoacyl-[acyl-carrier-protein] reductase n=1 Tax=Aerococcus agrisoli TaxID=2487350 RepID=A0A3N4GVP8_9LACT|nr:3-oxoacyl-[acyl-carrier-protein] reductase [Aerococcus agrisoli]RPA64968.1 3-oxoacyl-[acyl-carrier-protein] reductase [Aerococcus agrisoli]